MDSPAVAPVDPAPVVVSIANSDISPTDQSENIRSVLAFYEAALNEKDFDKAAKYLGPVYIQHNPGAEDGAEGFRKLVDMMKQKTPNRHSTILRAFGSGNYVILHVQVNNPDVADDRGSAIIDIFRMDAGKIVEHWDVRQEVPVQAKNANTMF